MDNYEQITGDNISGIKPDYQEIMKVFLTSINEFVDELNIKITSEVSTTLNTDKKTALCNLIRKDGNKIVNKGWITYNHKASGELLGYKADSWEGGFRVPFVLSWPERIKESSENSNMLCLTDLYATIAEIVGEQPDEDEAVDSYSFLSNMFDQNAEQVRSSMIISGGASGAMVAFKDNWKYIEAAEKGRWGETYYPYGPSTFDYQLYNLGEDFSEHNNLYTENPDKVNELRLAIDKVKNKLIQE